jgi:hypothetical protein
MEKFGSGMEKIRIQDGKNSDPGPGMEKIWIRDKHPGSATLMGRKCQGIGKKWEPQNKSIEEPPNKNQKKTRPRRQTFGRGSMGSLPCGPTAAVTSRGNSAGGLH